MNAHQLHSERLARWSQNGEARLTPESMAEWLALAGMCLWLPTGSSGAAPAPSFLEAVVGRPAPAPSAGEKARAGDLLARMMENAAAVPLKFGSEAGESPERIAGAEALRYVYALRGDRNFKNGPSMTGKASVMPLALHCFEAIRDQGPLTVSALQTALGRDITEAALGRALDELWLGLYVFPIWTGDPQQTPRWESLSRRFPEPVAAGACTSHAEAQSALISLYLRSVVAASEEEILAFLGPLASQSKLREVIRDLGSMRQLEMVDIGSRTHLCLQGEQLPEMAVRAFQAPPATERSVAEEGAAEESPGAPQPTAFSPVAQPPRRPPSGEADRAGPKKFPPKKFAAGAFRPKFTPSRFPRRDSRRPDGAGTSSKPEFSSGFRGRGKPPAKSGGKAWARPGNKPWMKKETDGPRTQRRDWGPRNDNQPNRESRGRDDRNRDDRNRDDRGRDDRGRDRFRENRPGQFQQSRGEHGRDRGEYGRDRDQHRGDRDQRGRDRNQHSKDGGSLNRPARRGESAKEGPRASGSAEKRPWVKKPQRSKPGGPKSKDRFAGSTESRAEGQARQPFWAGRPPRRKGAAGKSGAKRRPGGPRGKKK